MKITGSCHCGEVKWVYDSPLESATACNCTVCRRYGALWAYGLNGSAIMVSGKTTHYMRGKELEFHFCSRCGSLAYFAGRSHDEQGRQRYAVNLRLTEDPKPIQELHIDHFDGLDTWEDLPRDGRRIKDLWF